MGAVRIAPHGAPGAITIATDPVGQLLDLPGIEPELPTCKAGVLRRYHYRPSPVFMTGALRLRLPLRAWSHDGDLNPDRMFTKHVLYR